MSALFSLFFVLSSFFLSPHNNYEKLLEVNAKTTADFLWAMDEPLLMSWLTADFRAVLVPGSIYNYILFCFVLFFLIIHCDKNLNALGSGPFWRGKISGTVKMQKTCIVSLH